MFFYDLLTCSQWVVAMYCLILLMFPEVYSFLRPQFARNFADIDVFTLYFDVNKSFCSPYWTITNAENH